MREREKSQAKLGGRQCDMSVMLTRRWSLTSMWRPAAHRGSRADSPQAGVTELEGAGA